MFFDSKQPTKPEFTAPTQTTTATTNKNERGTGFATPFQTFCLSRYS
jgi:hypothetical protein